MRYLSFNSIIKRCPNGTRYDKETGKCIPVDEWRAKYQGKGKEGEEESDKERKCPRGKRRDKETGECIPVMEWRRKYQKKYRDMAVDGDTDKDKPAKEKQSSPDVPKPREYREIKKYGDDAHDIPTDEAEWIFNQGSDGKALQTKIDEQVEKIRESKDKFDEIKGKEDATPEELFDCLSTEGSMTVEHIGDDKKGHPIWSGDARYESTDKLSKESSTIIVDTVFDMLGKLYLPRNVKYGVQKHSGAYGCCWSNSDGSSTIRYTASDFNFLNDANDSTARNHEDVATYRVNYSKKVVVHEMVHANINAVVHDGVMKGVKNEEVSGDYLASYCGTVTHGDIPRSWNGGEAFNDSSCSKNYVYFGKFTQQVLKDAKKVAEELYGMDNDTFMRQMTAYGRTRAKEGIPEAIAEYMIDGENASLANKLIYHSFMRYARFVYDDEQKDIEPIYKHIRNLREKQGKNRTKRKAIHKQRYISFEEILRGVI